MKKTPTTLLLLGLCLSMHAEHHYLLSGELASGLDHHYIANSHILLKSGFKAEPCSGHEVLLSIDPYEVSPSNQGLTGGPYANQNGVVGAIDGMIDVGLMGSATYTIPIELPDGLGKMKPQLAICYNSQGRNGTLGWGWELLGISSITRVGRNAYYDGSTAPVNYLNDRFSLNGQRLMKISDGAYGGHGVIYHTEEDQMSKIVSYHEPGITGTASFLVYQADGSILSYGSTTDSKAMRTNQNLINCWLLKQITDRYGNEITYHYRNLEDEFLLERIDYSGNSRQQIPTAFSIEFQYDDRNDISLTFFGSQPFRQRHLLTSITIKNRGQDLYRYRFSYQEPTPQNGYPYTLLKEIGFFTDEQHYNPTTIQWGENNYPINNSATVRYDVTTSGIDNAFINAIKYSGDFNGDGYSDVIAVKPENGTLSTAELFLNKGTGNTVVFEHKSTFSLDPRISWINIADCDGDGRDDILFVNRFRNTFPLPDVINAKIYLSKINSQGDLAFQYHHLPDCTIPRNMIDALLVGDFLGEGKLSILIQSVSSENASSETALYYTYDKDTGGFLLKSFFSDISAERFFPADYNGDGITDILYKDSDGNTRIVQMHENAQSLSFQELNLCHPTDWDDCFPGDFNGDGMTDVLFFQAGNTHPWTVFFSSPIGLSNLSCDLPNNFPYTTPGNYHYSLDNPHSTSHYLKIGDFDGNGCDDIALFEGDRFYAFYGPLTSTGSTGQFAYSHQIGTQLFNLYDNMGVCIGNFLGEESLSFLGHTTLSHLPPLSLRHEVKRIIDGMGRKTELTYDYLVPHPSQPSPDDFYRLDSYLADHDQNIYVSPLPLRALESVTTYNMKNHPVTTRCRYEGALLHKQGKGFLGFSKTVQDDYCNHQLQKKVIRSYEIAPIQPIIHITLEDEHVYDGNGQLMAHSNYSNLYYLNRRNPKVFFHLADQTAEEYDIDHPGQLLKKEINCTTVSTDNADLFFYNDMLKVTETLLGTTSRPELTTARLCEYRTSIHTEFMDDLPNEWLMNRPRTKTTVIHHDGDMDLIKQDLYAYSDDNPFQLHSVTELPYEGNQPDYKLARMTTYEYDPFGNCISQTVSTPYDALPSRRERFEFGEEYGHLLLTKYVNPAGEETHYRYHPKYLYCTSITDCNGLETSFEQDPLGVTQTTNHPDGTKSIKTVRWNGDNFTVYEKKTGQAAKLTFHYKTGDPFMSHSYDINGNLVVSSIEHDALGRVIKTTIPHDPTQSAPSIEYGYSSHHQVARINHPDGTFEEIQRHGNETRSIRHDLDGNTQTEAKTLNVMGWTIRSTDADGTSVVYHYDPDGKLKWSQIEGHEETKIEMTYDGMRNRISLYDPNYGLVVNKYNAFGENTLHVTPKRDSTFFEYDVLGKLIRRIETDHDSDTPRLTEWIYSNEDGTTGLLTSVRSEQQSFQYEYDRFQRLQETHEYRPGKEYVTHYTYDEASRVASITFPTHLTVHYRYTSEGIMRSVLDDAGKQLWYTNETDPLQQPLKCTTGEGMVSTYRYDERSQRLVSIQSALGQRLLQQYRYEYDDFSNMTSRNDLLHTYTERFSYDPLNRLTSIDSDKGTSRFTYDPLGRMISKSDAGNLLFSNADYSGPRPHAIKSAETTEGVFPQERMELEYTAFDKVSSIKEGSNSVFFEYGHNHQRISVTEHIDGKTRRKQYVNQCEFIQSGQDSLERTFLHGPYGVFAVAETINGKTTLHYIHKDHLGSWTLITDQDGRVEQENRFDAWGNSMITEPLLFDRGFTGHEHIRGMGLINMNGRLYDPVTSSMLSPDNNIQMPDYSQNFNRYSYCINNPLSFTDPDGNTFIEDAVLFYIIFCTDFGYEFQKYVSPVAVHLDIHLSRKQMGVGLDVSIGVPKECELSYRRNYGATYYWAFYDNSYQGWEFRIGGEWCLLGIFSYSGTRYYSGELTQTTNAIIIGNYLCNVAYENDFMFNMANYLPGVPCADNGDRYRSAAARIMIGPIEFGINLFTGDPGQHHSDRRTFEDPEANYRETYTINENGDDPDRYRAGIAYIGIGPIKAGINSENVRHLLQNRFAHDFLCRGDSPYFKVLDRPAQGYFYFGTGTGSNLW